MKDVGMMSLKDRERAELAEAIASFGGKVRQIKSCSECAPKPRAKLQKKTRAELDVALKRRFLALAERVKVGFEVWHRYEILDKLLGLTTGSASKYASAGNSITPSARLISRLEEIVALGETHTLK